MEYKVGDKVRVRKDLKVNKTYYMADHTIGDSFVDSMTKLAGKTVTIKEITDTGKYRIKEAGYNWVDEMFEDTAVCPKKIIITVDDSKTIARLFDGNTVIKREEAECSPEDEFDFEMGAKLAMERLFKSEDLYKKGDWVRVIGNSQLSHGFDIGDAVIIVKVFDGTGLYCRRPYDRFDQWLHPADVKRLTK